jgi:hypothetical protein
MTGLSLKRLDLDHEIGFALFDYAMAAPPSEYNLRSAPNALQFSDGAGHGGGRADR